MPKRFKGNDVTLYLEEAVSGSGLTVWGCCQQLQVTESTEFIEVTPINGRDTSFLPTYDSVTIDASGLYVLEEYNDTVLPTETLRNWRRNHTKLNYLIIVGDITDYSYDVYSGQCYISQAVGSFNVDEAAGISINLIGVGASSDYSPASGTVPPPFSIACPSVTESQTDDSITFEFTAPSDTTSIVWEVLQGSTLIDSATLTPAYASPITVTVNGLAANTQYVYRIILNNTAENYSNTCQGSITTDAQYEVVILNTLTGATIDSVQEDGNNFITIVNGAFPLASGGTVEGNHDAFSGVIQVAISGTFTDGNMVLNKNNAFVECVNLNGTPGTYQFTTASYAANAIIEITVAAGTCS